MLKKEATQPIIRGGDSYGFFLLRGRIIRQGGDLLELMAHIIDTMSENNGAHGRNGAEQKECEWSGVRCRRGHR